MNTQTFFSELQRIIDAQPKRPTNTRDSENCDTTDNILFGKDLTECFDCQHCTRCTMVTDSLYATDCVSCDYAFESEDLYECQGAYKTSNCSYSDDIDQTHDVYYSSHLFGCHDMFGCTNLSNKSYCIFNRQFSESEYKEKIEKLKKKPIEKILAIVDALKLTYPTSNKYQRYNENTTYGRHFYLDKNCYMVFDASWNENCLYLHDSNHNKNSMDLCYGHNNIELGYEIVDSQQCFDCNYLVKSNNCQESSYLFDCRDVKNSLGCVKLEHKQYCILNRQFSKEEYEKISKEIFEALRKENKGWDTIQP